MIKGVIYISTLAISLITISIAKLKSSISLIVELQENIFIIKDFSYSILLYVPGVIIITVIIPCLIYFLIKNYFSRSSSKLLVVLFMYLIMGYFYIKSKYLEHLGDVSAYNLDYYGLNDFGYTFFDAANHLLILALFISLIIYYIVKIWGNIFLFFCSIFILWVIIYSTNDSHIWSEVYKFTVANFYFLIPFLMQEINNDFLSRLVYRVVLLFTLKSLLAPVLLPLYGYFGITPEEILKTFLWILDPLYEIISLDSVQYVSLNLLDFFINKLTSLSYDSIWDLFNIIIDFILSINLLDVKVPIFKVYIPSFDIKPYTPEILYNSLTVFIKNIVSWISQYKFIYMYIYNIDIETTSRKYIETTKPLVSTTLLMDNPNASGSFVNFHSNPNLDISEAESDEDDDWQESEYYFLVELFHDTVVKSELLTSLKKEPKLDLYELSLAGYGDTEFYSKPVWFTSVLCNIDLLRPDPDFLDINSQGSGQFSHRLSYLIVDEPTNRYTNFAKRIFCPHGRRAMYKDWLYTMSNVHTNVLTPQSFVRVSTNITKYLSTVRYTGISHVRCIHGIIHRQFFFALSGMSPDIVNERLSDVIPSINNINNELQKFQYKITIHEVDKEWDDSKQEEKTLLLENRSVKDGKRLIREVQYMRDYAQFTTSVILKHLPAERRITWGTPKSLR